MASILPSFNPTCRGLFSAVRDVGGPILPPLLISRKEYNKVNFLLYIFSQQLDRISFQILDRFKNLQGRYDQLCISTFFIFQIISKIENLTSEVHETSLGIQTNYLFITYTLSNSSVPIFQPLLLHYKLLIGKKLISAV